MLLDEWGSSEMRVISYKTQEVGGGQIIGFTPTPGLVDGVSPTFYVI